jgi:predicted dehydrogenase
VSESGTQWPYKDEFEVGCTIEHAGYAVTWLSGFFGPAQTVTAFSSCLIPDKETEPPLDVITPDFSVAAIKFHSGVVARLTCSIVAPRDHSLRLFGDEGVLRIDDLWNDRSPVYLRRMLRVRRRMLLTPWRRKYPLVGKSNPQVRYRGAQQRDFCRGIAELAEAVREHRSPRLAARYCLHNTEVVLAIQGALERGSAYSVSSSFEPIEPMAYALG